MSLKALSGTNETQGSEEALKLASILREGELNSSQEETLYK